jgi:hypothetical protein
LHGHRHLHADPDLHDDCDSRVQRVRVLSLTINKAGTGSGTNAGTNSGTGNGTGGPPPRGPRPPRGHRIRCADDPH